MGSFPEWLQVIAGILALLILIGGAAALITSSFNKARLDTLRGDLNDANNRNEALEHDIERRDLRHTADEIRITHLEQENVMLTDKITSRADVEQLGMQLAQHHTEAMRAWAAISAKLDGRDESDV